MRPRAPDFEGSYIVVADEDWSTANFVVETLGSDGHLVFWAYDGLSAIRLAFGLKFCDVVISNFRVGGQPGVHLIRDLRDRLPWLSILYLANAQRSSPVLEQQLPSNVPILREPFTAVELRVAVAPLLRQA